MTGVCEFDIIMVMRNQKFHDLLKRIGEIHDSKNSDYATNQDPFSNFRECERFNLPAWKGVMVRMSDKWCRLCNLVDKPAKNESFEDNCLDLAVYSLILYLLKQEHGK